MGKYKAVIIDAKKLAARGGAILLGIIASAVLLTMGCDRILENPDIVVKNNLPAIGTLSGKSDYREKISKVAENIVSAVLGFSPDARESIIGASLPVFKAASGSYLAKITQSERGRVVYYNEETTEVSADFNIPEENKAPIKKVDAAQKLSDNRPIAIANETSYGIDIKNMLSTKPMIDMSGQGPKVLITHTHATESYAPRGAEFYDVTASDRNFDTDKNVVAVGKKMAEVLRENGIETIHDEVLHDAPSFNGSYAHSLEAVTEYTEKYPSIQVVFDIHRDSIVYDDKTKAKTVTEIDGRQAAQLMFVVGTDENGLYNPNWRSNMKTAMHFQKEITAKYPRLMRHINLRKERFNGHTSGASMIIEVGTSGNSLDEALYSIEIAAKVIADYLGEL